MRNPNRDQPGTCNQPAHQLTPTVLNGTGHRSGTKNLMLRRVIFAFAMLAVLTAVSSARANAPSARSRAVPRATHWCRAGDPPLQLSRPTSCSLAAALIDRLFNGPVVAQGGTRTISVTSPVTRRSYGLQLIRSGEYVTATGPGGIWIRFFYEG
jgi:hypothetical protein